MTKVQIAAACHAVNQVYCESLGDYSQQAWEQASGHQRDSAILGVIAIINDPTITPEGLHESWMQAKFAAGWRHGRVKDAVGLTHPCLVPYAELPAAQREKDRLFRGTVDLLLPLLEK